MSISWLSPLRGRLVAFYVVALVVALTAFGAVAVFVIDRSLHAALDEDLQTTGQAALNLVDIGDGVPELGEHDRAQIYSIMEPQTDLAVLGSANRLIFSTTSKPSSNVLAYGARQTGLFDAGKGAAAVRAFAVPILLAGHRIGTVVVWTAAQWIVDTDRRVAIAFAIAALVLAAVAALAGTAVTKRALDDAFERQRRFTADASHELRAPLSIIRAEADLALRAPREPAAYQATLNVIVAEADRMEALVSSLLSAARAVGTDTRTEFDLQSVALRVSNRLTSAAKAKQMTMTVRNGAPCPVFADADALESAVTAVVHNAIKYAPVGGAIDVWTNRSGRFAELLICDNGPGLSTAALEHGLEWFWIGREGRTGEGSGVGLAVASSIAKAAGGQITLANAPGGGALVTFSLPAR